MQKFAFNKTKDFGKVSEGSSIPFLSCVCKGVGANDIPYFKL